MRIVLEATDPNQDFLIDIYKHNVRIVDAKESPNNWLDLYLEGSEINLLRLYTKYWCEPSVSSAIHVLPQSQAALINKAFRRKGYGTCLR